MSVRNADEVPLLVSSLEEWNSGYASISGKKQPRLTRLGGGLVLACLAIAALYVISTLSAQITSEVNPHLKLHIDPTITNDLGWIKSDNPYTLPAINPFASPRLATGPLGRPQGQVFDWEDFSDDVMKRFWDKWVGPVMQPQMDGVPLPPMPYPLPAAPPPLYPEYYSVPPEKILPELKFPPGFILGWATAAQQYEGAVQTDGRGPSVWDWASRFPGFISDNTTSDISDLGYYLYKQDLARMAALGGNGYAFSVASCRILPFGMKGSPINEKGLQYYQDLVTFSRHLGIQPVMTLFHWDTPLAIQVEYGGFASPRIIDDYLHYAEIMFRRFNGTVEHWFTFNEPGVFCIDPGYPQITTLPGNMTSRQYKYTSRKHLILAHARAYRLFKKLNIQGKISFKNDDYLGVPWRKDHEEDKQAKERHMAYYIGFFSEPIHLTGDWPEIVKADLPPEILPRFSAEEIELIKGTADFFAIDAYRVDWIAAPPEGIDACRQNRSHPAWPECALKMNYDSTGWAIGEYAEPAMGWLYNTWQFVRPLLRDLTERYPTSGGTYLTEFGFAEPYENDKKYLHQATQDPGRTHLVISYLAEILKGVVEDQIPIKGVFAWSSVDNWEWTTGFKARFGSQFVDYSHPTLRRTFKRSALEMAEFWKSHRHVEEET